MKPPRVQIRYGDSVAVDLQGWVRRYVHLLMELEGVKVATTTAPPVHEASNDR